jgi:hypothetical protein
MKMKQTIQECGRLTTAMMKDYEKEILQAIKNLEPDDDEGGAPKLSISFGFVLESKPEDVFAVTATMTFTEKKVKDKATTEVDERQRALFNGEENTAVEGGEDAGEEGVQRKDAS